MRAGSSTRSILRRRLADNRLADDFIVGPFYEKRAHGPNRLEPEARRTSQAAYFGAFESRWGGSRDRREQASSSALM